MKKVFLFARQKIFNLLDKIQLRRRKKIVKKKALILKNKDFTLLSNNCNGGVISSELGVRFNSPFVNLNINPRDYVKYLKNLDYYSKLPIKVEFTDREYPMGFLGDLTIEFIHYRTCEEAEQKWIERTKRINTKNLFVMLTEQEDCTEELIREFNDLPFENKVVFTYKKHENIGCSVYLEKFKDNPRGVYMFLGFENRISAKRKFDCFDFVSWFNGEKDLSKLLLE